VGSTRRRKKREGKGNVHPHDWSGPCPGGAEVGRRGWTRPAWRELGFNGGKKREGKREEVGPSGQTERGRDFAVFFPFFNPNPFSKITFKYF